MRLNGAVFACGYAEPRAAVPLGERQTAGTRDAYGL